ncbi:hypothetical protein [Catalinimonas niigatensis]|nr:hypothetical protein [Catalinimonas niigatensis]WPP50543.1 hypothetical protein PZB72_28160 [Catalinimonas niigatensis]
MPYRRDVKKQSIALSMIQGSRGGADFQRRYGNGKQSEPVVASAAQQE